MTKPRPPRKNVPTGTPADAEQAKADPRGLDLAARVAIALGEEVPGPASATVRPPTADDPGDLRDPREEPPDDEKEDDDERIDIAAFSRAANTAASLGRAPVPQPTAKMQPFDLADALAKLSEKDEDDKGRP